MNFEPACVISFFLFFTFPATKILAYMTNKKYLLPKTPFHHLTKLSKVSLFRVHFSFLKYTKKNSEKKVQSNLSEGCHSGFVRRRFCYYYGPFPKLILLSVCFTFLAISLSELIYEFTHTVVSGSQNSNIR